MAKSDDVIAFSAEMSTDTSLVANVPIVFDRVIMNTGGLYFNNTGQFVCADDELYVFIWSTLKAGHSDIPGMRCIAKLRSGGFNTKYGPKTSYYSTGHSGVAEMTTVIPCTTSPPTAVSIMSAPWDEDENSVAVYRGNGWTSFSGFHLQAPIAFTAKLLQDQYLTAGGKIRFDRVLYTLVTTTTQSPTHSNALTMGSTYSGFRLTPRILLHHGLSRLMIQGELVVQGPITYITTSSYNSGSTSSTAVLQCTQGFSVYMEAQPEHDFILNSYSSELTQSRVQVDICVQLDFVCQYNIQVRITPSGCKPMFTHRPNHHQARKY